MSSPQVTCNIPTNPSDMIAAEEPPQSLASHSIEASSIPQSPPREKTSKNSTRRLRSKLSFFEERIQRNKAEGRSSVPCGVCSPPTALDHEGRPSFRVSSKHRSRALSSRQHSQEAIRSLSNQLNEVIANLHHTEIKHADFVQDHTLLVPTLIPVPTTIQTSHPVNGSTHSTNSNDSLWELSIDSSTEAKAFAAAADDLWNEDGSDASFADPADTLERLEEESAIRLQCLVRRLLAQHRYQKKRSSKRVRFSDHNQVFGTKADELRLEIAAIQRQLDALPAQTQRDLQDMKEGFRIQREKLQDKAERHGRRIRNTERRQNRGRVVQLDKMKCAITYLKGSNTDLRTKQTKLQRGIGKLKDQQVELERESQEIAERFRLLTLHTMKLQEDNDNLRKAEEECKQFSKPLWRDAILDHKVYGASEERQTKLYRKTIQTIREHMMTQTDLELKDSINIIISDNELVLTDFYDKTDAPLSMHSRKVKPPKTFDSDDEGDDDDDDSCVTLSTEFSDLDSSDSDSDSDSDTDIDTQATLGDFQFSMRWDSDTDSGDSDLDEGASAAPTYEW